MKNILLLTVLLLLFTSKLIAQVGAEEVEPPPPVEMVGDAVISDDGRANTFSIDENSPKNKNLGLKYSTVKKLDFWGGDEVQIAWARTFIDHIENADFKSIKAKFGIDSAKIYPKVKPILEKFNWPKEASPGWIKATGIMPATKFLRTYYDKYDSAYVYQYQVEINFANGKPNISFREGAKVIHIDLILNNYYAQLKIQKEKAAIIDENAPCSPPKTSLSDWYKAVTVAEGNEDYDLAIEFLEKCLWGKPTNVEWQEKKAVLLVQANRFEEALSFINILDRKDNYQSQYIKRYAEFQLGRYEDIIKTFNSAADPNKKETLFVINSYIKAKQPEKALDLIDNKKLSANMFEKYELYYLTNNKVMIDSTKKNILESLSRSEKSNYKDHRSLAQSYYNIGEYASAIKHHRLSLLNERESKAALLDLAEALIPAGEYSEAFTITGKLLQDENLKVRDRIIYLYLNSISGYLASQKYEESEKELYTLINAKNKLLKDNSWSLEQFVYWYKSDTTLSEQQREFVNRIISDVTKAINP